MNKQRLKIAWTEPASSDLKAITDYIRPHSPAGAKKIRQQIRDAVCGLTAFPLSGRSVPEFPEKNFRELIVGNYRVVYEIVETWVVILAVVHGARDLSALPQFQSEDE